MIRLVRTVPEVKQAIDNAAVVRQIRVQLAPKADGPLLEEIVRTAAVVDFKPGDTLIEQGAQDDLVFLIQSGSVTVSVRVGGKDITSAYIPAGNYVGEMAMLMRAPRSATVKAAVPTEAIRIDSAAFRSLLESYPELRKQVEAKLGARLLERQHAQLGSEYGGIIEFFTRTGAIEATDVLLIDELLCVRCDNCEKACAETHHGVSWLNREAGPTYASLHVPTSCRHCEDPHCMKDCPPDAIHRAPNGEVFIDGQLHRLWQLRAQLPLWRHSDGGHASEETEHVELASVWHAAMAPAKTNRPKPLPSGTGSKHAVKCDMCKDIEGGPACVRACPTGAAIRVDPEQFIQLAQQGGG